MQFRNALLIFILVASPANAEGLLKDYGAGFSAGVGGTLSESQRNIQREAPAPPTVGSGYDPTGYYNRTTEQSASCWTELGSCSVESTLKGTKCFCNFKSGVVFGVVQ